jgi:glycosyltransferase involved in cell wall biosynthesis
MRIGVNLLFLIPGVSGGVQTYAVSLLRALENLDSDNEYFIFLNREAAQIDLPTKPSFRYVICPFSASSRLTRYLWEQSYLPIKAAMLKLDVLHSPGYVGPIHAPCARILTIPDTNWVDIKETIPVLRRLILGFVSKNAARTSDRVLTISHFSKRRISEHLGISSDRIEVTHLGPRPAMPGGEAKDWSDISQSYGIAGPYIVVFGGLSPHKNIRGLIDAYSHVKSELSHSLLIIGHLPPDISGIPEARSHDGAGQIIATGYVPDDHVLPLLSHADLFLFPSWYEGFGLPVLEAQQVGVPVACSTAGSLPEVAGESAVFFDPHSTEDIGRAIRETLADKDLLLELRRKGYLNLSRFSWEKTARETLDIYYQVTSKPKPAWVSASGN